MFWAENPANHCTLSALLDAEKVSLAELLDHEDILQECRTQNKKLIEFLENGNTIEELIDLIIKEPQINDDPTNRFKHSAIACEIITSDLYGLVENMANTPGLLKKLFSFLDSSPPLNPLLASFFAKTFNSLLVRHAGQNWYSYNVMCFQVLEYSKESPTFLPKLLEHIGTSAIMDTLECIALMDDSDMKKVTLDWLDSQNLIEKLIALLCGNYVIEATPAPDQPKQEEMPSNEIPTQIEPISAQTETLPPTENVLPKIEETPVKIEESPVKTEDVPLKTEETPTKIEEIPQTVEQTPVKTEDAAVADETLKQVIVEANTVDNPVDDSLQRRILADRSENAAKLLCNIIMKGREPNNDAITKTTDPLVAKCTSNATIDLLLNSMFSSNPAVRQSTIVNGIQVILSLLNDSPGPSNNPPYDLSDEVRQIAETIMPYFPKFKEVILESPPIFKYGYSNGISKPMGATRLAIIRLLDVMLDLDNQMVATAFVKSEIMPILLDMFVEYKWNNFLHSHIERMIKQMVETTIHKDIYNIYLFVDCKLIDRIIDAWELNDDMQSRKEPKCGYMGHLIHIANTVQNCLMMYPQLMDEVSLSAKSRWPSFLSDQLNKVNEVQNLYLGRHHPHDPSCNNSMQNQQAFNDILDIQTQEINYEDDDDCEFKKSLENFEEMLKSRQQNQFDAFMTDMDFKYPDANSQFSEPSDVELNEVKSIKSIKSLYNLANQLSSYDDSTFIWNSDLCTMVSNNQFMGSLNFQPSAVLNNDSPWGNSGSSGGGANEGEWADFSSFNDMENINFDPFMGSPSGLDRMQNQDEQAAKDDAADSNVSPSASFTEAESELKTDVVDNVKVSQKTESECDNTDADKSGDVDAPTECPIENIVKAVEELTMKSADLNDSSNNEK